MQLGVHSKRKTWLVLLCLLGFIVALNAFFLAVSPQSIVESLGVENSYLLLFLLASFGGLNAFSSPLVYTSIATFAAGGANPWLLGLAGGLGIAIGDMLLFYLFTAGRVTAERMLQAKMERLAAWRQRTPQWLQVLALYGILGFTPVPNDLVMAAVVVMRFRARTIGPLLIASGITLATLTALGGGAMLSALF